MFLPVILSSVIVALVWKQFLHPVFGLLNKTLSVAGFGMVTTPWLGLSETALWRADARQCLALGRLSDAGLPGWYTAHSA